MGVAVTSADSLSCLILMRVGCLLHQRVQYLLGSIEMSHASMEISDASIDFGPVWLGREAKAIVRLHPGAARYADTYMC